MSTTWWRITVTSPSDELTALLAEGLVACGGSAVQEDGAELSTWVPAVEDADGALARIRAALRDAAGVEVDVRCETVADRDWLQLWRSGLGPRRVGPRLIIAPTWSEVSAGPREVVIRIDPQMAFGTGEHASTRGVLRLLQRVVLPGVRLLDVGAGSGILAIAAARLGASHVVAAESDADALDNAQQNVDGNHVAERVTIVHAFVDEPFLAAYGGGAFDGITANVLSGALRPLLPAFHHALVADGWAILSGILVSEADAMTRAAGAHGFHVEATDVEEQWWSVLLRRL